MTTSPKSPPSGVPEPSSGGNQRRILFVALGTVIAAVIAVVVVVSTGGSSTPKLITLLQVQPVRITGEPLPTPEAGASDNSLGKSVPRIDGKTFGSRSISIKPGKPTLVVAINRADADVQAEVEALVQWHHAYLTPEALNVITLVTGPDRDGAADPVSSWLVREEWPVPVLVDDAASSAAAALGFLATPAFLIVGTDGIVRFRALGALPIDRLVLELKNQLGL